MVKTAFLLVSVVSVNAVIGDSINTECLMSIVPFLVFILSIITTIRLLALRITVPDTLLTFMIVLLMLNIETYEVVNYVKNTINKLAELLFTIILQTILINAKMTRLMLLMATPAFLNNN